MSTDASRDLRESLSGLVDDAAIFPPGNAAMPEAVRAHGEHHSAWYSPVVGAFVCSDTRLPEVQQALDGLGSAAPSPLHVSLTISGGAGAVEPALVWVQQDQRLRLDGVEAALRDEADLAHNAMRLTTVLSDALPDHAIAYIEMPRLYGAETTAGWSAAADEVAASGHRLKYRTGGLDPDAFPSSAELAAVIESALDRELELKLTAGLHHAVRRTADDTGFEHHGFLNVLLATRAVLDGAARADVEALLEQRDATTVAEQVRALGDARLRSARRWFCSFGSCSVTEPVDDLLALGLLRKG